MWHCLGKTDLDCYCFLFLVLSDILTGGGLLHVFYIVSVTCNLSLDNLLLCRENSDGLVVKSFFFPQCHLLSHMKLKNGVFHKKTHCIAVDPLDIHIFAE